MTKTVGLIYGIPTSYVPHRILSVKQMVFRRKPRRYPVGNVLSPPRTQKRRKGVTLTVTPSAQARNNQVLSGYVTAEPAQKCASSFLGPPKYPVFVLVLGIILACWSAVGVRHFVERVCG